VLTGAANAKASSSLAASSLRPTPAFAAGLCSRYVHPIDAKSLL